MKKQKRFGQAIVEMALVIPIFIYVFIAIIDAGRLYHCWSTINHMCVEAARVASKRIFINVANKFFTPTTHADISVVTTEFWKYSSPLTPQSSFSNVVFNGVGQSTNTVSIGCDFNYEPWVPGASTLLGQGPNGNIILRASVSQRKE